jgi:hypothetical protein
LGNISAPGAKTPAPEPASPPREGAPVAAPTAPQPDAQEPGDALSRLKAAKRRARKEGG